MRTAEIVVLLSLACLAVRVRSFIMNRCSLARAMSEMGVPRPDLDKWTCIAYHESRYNTTALGAPNLDGSRDYGIFQINSRYWCQAMGGPSRNICQVACSALRSDDIRPSVLCAQQVQRAQGWSAWSVYNQHCNRPLPSIYDCFSRG